MAKQTAFVEHLDRDIEVEVESPRMIAERRVGWIRENEPIILRDWVGRIVVDEIEYTVYASVDHDRVPRTWDTLLAEEWDQPPVSC